MSDQYVVYQEHNSLAATDIDRRYYLNFKFDKHIHANPELIYVTEGEMDITVDGNTMTIGAERFCLVLPWQIHSFDTREYSRSVVIVFANQYVDIFSKNMLGFYGETQDFEVDPELRALFLKYLYKGSFPDEYIITSILMGMCHSFVSACKIVPRFEQQRVPILYNMLHYITLNCSDELTLRDVADKLGYSYYHLSHIFRDNVGMSFRQFCNMNRVGEAQRLLRYSDKSMTDVAFESGFSSVRNFNRIFREVMGQTPGEYREKYSKIVNGVRISIDEGMTVEDA